MLKSNNARFLPNLPILVSRLRRIIRDWEPDIVHCHLETDSAICLLARRGPLVRTVHSANPFKSFSLKHIQSWPIKWLNCRTLRGKRVNVVACGPAVQTALLETLSLSAKDRLFRVDNGIDLSSYLQAIRNSDTIARPPEILMIGTLSRTKNHRMALNALRSLADSGVQCYMKILGEGNQREYLEELCRELKLSSIVKLVGNVPDIVDHLQSASLFWMTSYTEGFALAMIEAMVAGVPCIGTKVPGIKELLCPWPGLLVPLNDFPALANKTKRLLNDPEKMARVGSDMRRRACTHYGAERMVDEYIEVYQSVTGTGINRSA